MSEIDNTNKIGLTPNIQVIEKPLPVRIAQNHQLHTRIVDFVRGCFQLSKKYMDSKRDVWRENEKQYYAYMPVEAPDKSRQVKARPDATYPGTSPIIIPISFATVQTILAYLENVFFANSPLLQVTGIGPEDVKAAENMEIVLDYQVCSDYIRGRQLLKHFFQDVLVYNLGVIRTGWTTVNGDKVVFDAYGTRSTLPDVVYDGNQSFLIDPYNFYPDPRVSISNLNDGEFCGASFKKSWYELKRGEANGLYFNIDLITDTKSMFDDVNKDRDIYHSINTSGNNDRVFSEGARDESKGFVELCELEVDLIPRDYGLSDNESPEKWILTVANGDVLIKAAPLNDTNFSFIASTYYHDGHSFLCKGLLETISGLQESMSWLINSRMENVRKAINDQFVVDPSMVEIDDIIHGGPGKLIRKKPQAYGLPIRGIAVEQFPVTDVTLNHLRDLQVDLDIVQRVTAANDSMQGVVDNGGRKTATEIRSASVLAGGRLKTQAEYLSETAIMPWGKQLIRNTQRYLTKSRYYRIIGETNQAFKVNSNRLINPQELSGNFDFKPRDGTLPIDRFAQAAIFKEFLQVAASNPIFMQTWDTNLILIQALQNLGVKNSKDYIRANPPVQVTPDEQVAKQFGNGDIQQVGGMRPDMNGNPMTPNTAGEGTIEGMMGGM